MAVLPALAWLLVATVASNTLQAQTAAPAGPRISGEVSAVDEAKSSLTIKKDDGGSVSVGLVPGGTVKQVDTSGGQMKAGDAMSFNQLKPGDRVLLRGTPGGVADVFTTTQIYVLKKEIVAAKQQEEQQAWRTQSLFGAVKSVDAAAKTAILLVGRAPDQKEWTVALAPSAKIRRYADDSNKFANSREAKFEELTAGDTLRILGKRDAEKLTVTADQMIFGNFRTLGGEIRAVNPEKGEISFYNLVTKKNQTIKIVADATIRKMPDFAAMRGRMGGGGMGGGAGMGGGMGGQRPQTGGAPQAGGAPPSGGAPQAGGQAPRPGGGFPGGPGGGPGGRAFDPSAMLERMPIVKLADLQMGDAVIVTVGAPNSDKPFALNLVAGVDSLLRSQQVGQVLANWNTEGGAGGVF